MGLSSVEFTIGKLQDGDFFFSAVFSRVAIGMKAF